MGNIELGFTVLSVIAGSLTILAIILHNGKRIHDKKEVNRHSLNNCYK
jgi:hypothetical protein